MLSIFFCYILKNNFQRRDSVSRPTHANLTIIVCVILFSFNLLLFYAINGLLSINEVIKPGSNYRKIETWSHRLDKFHTKYLQNSNVHIEYKYEKYQTNFINCKLQKCLRHSPFLLLWFFSGKNSLPVYFWIYLILHYLS